MIKLIFNNYFNIIIRQSLALCAKYELDFKIFKLRECERFMQKVYARVSYIGVGSSDVALGCG